MKFESQKISKLSLKLLRLFIPLMLLSLACTVAVDYDGDGVVPGLPTNTPSNKIEDDLSKPTLEATQTPVCPLSAEILTMFTIPEGYHIPANSDFIMAWQIENIGCSDWPNGIYLQNISGSDVAQILQIPVPALKAGEIHTLEVPMTVKDITSTSYQTTWKLSDSSNTFFGPDFMTLVFIDPIENSKTIQENDSDTPEVIIIDEKPVAGEVEIISGPDMVIQNVEIISSIDENNNVEFLVTLFNQGVEDMLDFSVLCKNENNDKDEVFISYAEKNQITQFSCFLPINENSNQISITVIVDSQNSQLELDETNNIETYTFTMTTTE